MNGSRMRHALVRGVVVALGLFTATYAVSLLRPSTPPNWPVAVLGPLVLGTVCAILAYFEASRVRRGT